jgi:exodeoxyribonuclease VII large subunit
MIDGGRMELFGAPAPVLTVTQLNSKARQLLERSFTQVQVAGEISNLKHDRSGHRYFCLKDAGGVISAAMFRREVMGLRFELKDGLQVVATGNVTIYGPSGRYQLVVNRLAVRGAGALQAAFEELKRRLQEEGLFARERKRPLPRVPRRVAIITSPTGAVLKDILHVSTRRFPNAQLLLVPCRVQGPDCALQVARAIERVGALRESLGLDVLIVARGGGSLEDLWGFNDERVARAIAACALPVVSAVGHETDFTIADFVADVRAPTPSAAAELVFPQKSELLLRLQRLQARIGEGVRRDLQRQRLRLRALRAELGDGKRPVYVQTQRLAALQGRLEGAQRRVLAERRGRLTALDRRLATLHPHVRLQSLKLRVAACEERLARQIRRQVQARRDRLAGLGLRLDALSPLAVLGRGYGIVLNEAGHALRRAGEAVVGERLNIRLSEGSITARVEP